MRSARGSACCAFALLSMPERGTERDEKGSEGIEKISMGHGKEEG
jgi:hypothetical protein